MVFLGLERVQLFPNQLNFGRRPTAAIFSKLPYGRIDLPAPKVPLQSSLGDI